MIFNSLTYLLLLVLVVPLYWWLPTRPRLWLVFIASLVFYGFWRWEYTGLMLGSTVLDYYASIGIDGSSDPRVRRSWLAVSLIGNLGSLFYFKYLVFFATSGASLLQLVGADVPPPEWSILLPLGISFYTFQTLSYTIDVYRRVIPAQRDFVLYGCFVTFFPQLVAGPILRSSEVTDQLAQRASFRWTDLSEGARRIIYGLFLKVVLADNIAPVVDEAFEQRTDVLSAWDVWTMAFLFGFQIYFDFAGYSHIAVGTARLMGVHFPENFAFPYGASSPRDFWRRWHISLSSWIRDYLYVPLSGARFARTSTGGLDASAVGDRRRDVALLLTWAIMGLWHGANWTFVVWGLYHAVLVLGHRLLTRNRAAESRATSRNGWLGWAVTLPLVMLGWIPFRATTLAATFTMFGRVLDPRAYLHLGSLRENVYLAAALMTAAALGAYAIHLHAVPWVLARPWRRFAVETGVYCVAVALVFVFLRPIAQFIYFQF